MSVNYDPNGKPEVSADMINLARDLGLQVVNVICDEGGAQVGDHTGVSFIAMTPFLPRPGDRIALEDGRICQTKCAFFKLSRMTGYIGLVPTVYATLINN